MDCGNEDCNRDRDQIFSTEQKLETTLVRGWIVKRKLNEGNDALRENNEAFD